MFGTVSRDHMRDLITDMRDLHANARAAAIALRDAGGCPEEEADEHLSFIDAQLAAAEQHAAISLDDGCAAVADQLRERQRVNWRAGTSDPQIADTLSAIHELEENRRYGVHAGFERYAAANIEQCQQHRHALRARATLIEDDLAILTQEV